MTDPISQTASPQTAQPQNSPARSKGSALTSDFETFLRMLTAQARNQDPLEPLDSSEYAAQLAQFSMVEQQVKTNDMLTDLVTRLGALDMARLSGWVGMEARAVAPAHFDGAPVTVAPTPLATAERAVLVVRNDAGDVVDRRDIPVSADPIEWDGLESGGQVLPAGLYSFSVESYVDGSLADDISVATYNRIVEAQVYDGQVVLMLEGGQAVRADMVTAVRTGT